MRRCEHPGCITILNSWNSGDLCYAHEDERAFAPRPVTARCAYCNRPIETHQSRGRRYCNVRCYILGMKETA